MLPISLLLLFNFLASSFADDHLDGEEMGKKRGYGDDCACLSETTIPGMIALINKQSKRIEKLEEMMSSYSTQKDSDCNSGGLYAVYPTSDGILQASCDQSSMGGRWTVIQRRTDGSVDFYRTYQEYVAGFGNQQEYWLGLQHIHEMTKNGEYALLIEMTDYNGKEVYAYYNFFMLDSASRGYPLQIGNYQGTAGDSLSVHRNRRFSAYDKYQDMWDGNCAERYQGGWWYVNCHASNLNGLYYDGGIGEYGKGVNWKAYFDDYYGSFVKVEMKIRKRRRS